jgi:putative ABC transport system permease protein
MAHKLRSSLTMLGIIFGVAAVIAMLAIGEGARRKTLSQIQSLGLQNIIVQQQELSGEEDEELQDQKMLNFNDVKALGKIIPVADAVVPVIEREYEAVYETRTSEIKLVGTVPAYFEMMNLKLVRGGYFSAMDNRGHQRVCILGSAIARELFLVENPLKKMLKIGKVWFRVIGVLEYQPVSVAGTQQVDLNRNVYAPINTVNIRFDRDETEGILEQIVVKVREGSPIVATADLIDQILFRRHNDVKNYALIVPERLLQQSEETQRIFNIVMGAIAGISLLVGGIGIMNIMLASVLERTREIGVRRSLGATQRNIRNQFLMESVTLSLLGGIAGVLLGYGLAFGITLYSEWETAISIWSVILAFGVSSGVGVIFGYVPARKAAELNPIDALRYE